jgi:hypothetical protein
VIVLVKFFFYLATCLTQRISGFAMTKTLEARAQREWKWRVDPMSQVLCVTVVLTDAAVLYATDFIVD